MAQFSETSEISVLSQQIEKEYGGAPSGDLQKSGLERAHIISTYSLLTRTQSRGI